MARKKTDDDPKMPPPLFCCGVTTLGWGIVFSGYYLYKLIDLSRFLMTLDSIEVKPREADVLRGGAIALTVLFAFLFFLALLTLIAGFGLLQWRSATAATTAKYGPGGAALFALIGAIAEFYFIRGSSHFVGHLLGLLLTFVLGAAACVFHFWVLNDRKNTRALR